MSAPFRAACLQLTPGNVLDGNLKTIVGLAAAAADEGATLIALPEFATFLDRDSRAMRGSAEHESESEALSTLRETAARLGVWLLVGSIALIAEGDAAERLVNRSFLLRPDGSIAARYDKIHLFDARLADGRTVGESRHYRGGGEALVVETPFGRIGMSICYDLRFPHLYRALAVAGADILVVPSAFTAETGLAHWETLLRARAIETGCFVLAPATAGRHPGDWLTYGHASIVDPWGAVLAACGEDSPVFCSATIDLDRAREVRSRIPSLATNPPFTVTRTSAL